MKTIDKVKEYFTGRCDEIISMSARGDAWIFLCGTAMIDYLTQLTTGLSGKSAYIKFTEEYFSEVNSLYKDFKFLNGNQDLPTQMYVILRCGLVHKFSFMPGKKEIQNGGRLRSILVAHEKNGVSHLNPYTENGFDSVIFTGEQFAKDIKSVVEIIFKKAMNDSTLNNNIEKHILDFPPINLIQNITH